MDVIKPTPMPDSRKLYITKVLRVEKSKSHTKNQEQNDFGLANTKVGSSNLPFPATIKTIAILLNTSKFLRNAYLFKLNNISFIDVYSDNEFIRKYKNIISTKIRITILWWKEI